MSGLFARSIYWDMLAPALFLVAPITAFITYHGYGYFTVEVLVGLGAVVLTGGLVGLVIWKSPTWFRAGVIALLMTVYVDIQFYRVLDIVGGYWPEAILIAIFAFVVVCGLVLHKNLTQILAVVFVTMIAATVVVPGHEGIARTVTTDVARRPNSTLPPIIHIILDEHIGIEGIPTEVEGGATLKEEIKSFYRQRGFYVFGKAFTRFEFTTWSISRLMNDATGLEKDLFGYGKNDHKFRLKKGEYLKDISSQGYAFNIYQPIYLDYCHPIEAKTRKCVTHNFKSMKYLRESELDWPVKLGFLSIYLFSETVLYQWVSKSYWALPKFNDRSNVLDTTWHGEKVNVIGPIASLRAFDLLEQDLREAPSGTYFLIHSVLPHFPFVYDRSCRLAAPSLWTNKEIPPYVSEKPNSVQSRGVRYRRYFEQLRCVYKRLARLIDNIDRTPALADAVILIQGDHGSRIIESGRERLESGDASPSDYIATFSTLMTVRSAGIRPGYSLTPLPIQGLLSGLRATGFQALPDDLGSPIPQSVFLMPHVASLEGEAWTTIPMPEFGAAAVD